MVMMGKKMVKVPSVPKTVTVDGEFVSNFSSQCGPATMKLKKDGHRSSMKKLKNVESTVSKIKNLSSQYRSRKNGRKTIDHQSGDSVRHPSYQDQVGKGNELGVAYGARTDTVRGEAGGEILTCEDAALTLMKLANDSWRLPNYGLYKNRRDGSVNRMSGSKVIDQLNDTIASVNQSQTASCNARCFEKFQALKVEDMKEENGSLHKKKRKVGNTCSLLQSKYMNDDFDEQGQLNEKYQMLEDHELINKLQNKGQLQVETYLRNSCNRFGKSSLGGGRGTKKQKKKIDVPCMGELVKSDHESFKSKRVFNEPTISSIKKQLLKEKTYGAGSSNGLVADSLFSNRGTEDSEVLESNPSKKLELSPVTSTVHKGFSFSFSIIHFLSAVRSVMVTPVEEVDTTTFSKHLEKGNSNMGQTEKNKLPSLTVNEIIEQVRTNLGDPCIREAQEPLEDLVRGALNIFSSKLAPSGAKGWQALVLYSKSRKSWSWIGPVSFKPNETIEELVSAEAWGLPSSMLVKLVDSFANWLRSFDQTLQQIGSLPVPPMTSMQTTANLEERLRSVRPRRCIATISPCSEEVRAYFHKEEALRYSVPEKAFSYTALDGRKSTVAPLRRSSGKPSSKVRDHFMLRADRPPHVTVLCLVRDAAARLPASMGTRLDVCTLMRDSQYMVEDISDKQLNQVVSRGLDRLHYENDPSVRFNGERKLWVYLHGERGEDDFEDVLQ